MHNLWSWSSTHPQSISLLLLLLFSFDDRFNHRQDKRRANKIDFKMSDCFVFSLKKERKEKVGFEVVKESKILPSYTQHSNHFFLVFLDTF